MASRDIKNHTRRTAKKFGLGKRLKRADASLLVNETTTAWEIYNNRATKTDTELIKDCSDSLNTLLIFAALYSAVLTAFIIESLKLLQENTSDIGRDILLIISRQLANTSENAYEAETFVAPAFAVRVNRCFFLSISFSLLAALGAVLALQWIGSYDVGLSQSSPEERALQRHFRHLGIQNWGMVRIIAFLPALVYLALFLFLAGLAEWLWNVDKSVAGIIIAGLICGAGFFFVTTIISMCYVLAPFRTPASRSLPKAFAKLYCSLVSLLVHTSPEEGGDDSPSDDEIPSHGPEARPEDRSFVSRLRQFAQHLRNLHLVASFDSREIAHINSIVDRKRTALLSLASSLEVLPHTAIHFRAIIREILLLPPDQLVDSVIEQQAPWKAIFDVLLNPYLLQSEKDGFSTHEVADLGQTLQAYSLVCTIPDLQSHFPKVLEITRGARARSIQTASLIIEMKHPSWYSYLFDDLCTIFSSMDCLPTNFLHAHLLNLHNQQREKPDQDDIPINFSGRDGEDRQSLAQVLHFDLTAPDSVCLPGPLQDVLFKILAMRYKVSIPPEQTSLTSIERYSQAVETFVREEPELGNIDVAKDIHYAIISQVLGSALQKLHQSSHAILMPAILQLGHLLPAIPSSIYGREIILPAFQILRASQNIIWDRGYKLQTAQLYARLLPTPYSFDGGDWLKWRTHFYIGLQVLLAEREWFSASSRQLIWEQASMEARGNDHDDPIPPEQFQRLSRIQDPVLLLYVSSGSSHLWTYPSSVRIAVETRDGEEIKRAMEHWCDAKIRQTDVHTSELAFLRSAVFREHVTSRVITRLASIQRIDGRTMSSDDWRSLLEQPVLARILQRGNRLDLTSKVMTLRRVCQFRWFFDEFTAANGFSWLEENVDHWMIRPMVTIVCKSLQTTNAPHEVTQWMVCLHRVLSSVRNPGYDPREILHRPEDLIKVIIGKDVAQDQRKELIDGLRQGFICVAPMARFGRDPDGMV